MPLAVGALPVVILAVVALIILYGLALLLRSVLQGLANHIPVVGGGLSTVIGSVIDDAVTLGANAARSALHGIIAFVLAPVYWIEAHITAVIATFDSLIQSVAYILSTLIPSIIASLRAEIAATYNAAISYAHSTAVDVINLVNGDVAALYRDLSALQASLISYIDTETTAAEHYAAALAASETAYIDQVAGALSREIAASAAAESAFTASSFQDAISFTVTAVGAAETTLAGDITGLSAWVGQEVSALQAYIAATGAAALAYAAGAVAVVEADLGNLKSECTDNLCSGLSDLASLFNALTGDLGLGALFALAAEFAADPDAAAREVHSTLGPVAEAASGAVRTLIGI